MFDKYILVGHEPLLMENLLEWARWFEAETHRHVALTQISPQVRVSTMFLGLDHNFWMEGPPILFETMVFGGSMNGEQERYTTWDEAARGHEAMVSQVKEIVALEKMA